MFDGFIHKQIETQETTINLVQGGRGDPERTAAELIRFLA
jgi:hypothetical protein